jgi:hypothetical protein
MAHSQLTEEALEDLGGLVALAGEREALDKVVAAGLRALHEAAALALSACRLRAVLL